MVYPRQTSNTWYLKRWPYRIFMLRELSAVFLAAYLIELLVLVIKVHDGKGAFNNFADTLENPWLLGFNVVVLLFALLHTATWFLAVPSALQLRRGEEKVPAPLLIGAAYAVMLGASGLILLLFLL